jgi:hypothetical protein
MIMQSGEVVTACSLAILQGVALGRKVLMIDVPKTNLYNYFDQPDIYSLFEFKSLCLVDEANYAFVPSSYFNKIRESVKAHV